MESKPKKLFFEEVSMNEAEQLYFDTAEEYYRVCGGRVPRDMIPAGITEEEIISAMQKCIQSGKDELLEILGVGIDRSVLY